MAAHVLYSFGGKLPGNQSWSIGLRTGAAQPAQGSMQATCDYVEGAFFTFWQAAGGIKSLNPAMVTYEQTKMSAIGIDGKTTDVAVTPRAGAAGTASGPISPDQTSLVVSLLSNLAGRHGRGRVYLPLLAAITDGTTGHVPQTAMQIVATAFADLISALDPGDTSTTSPNTLPAGVILHSISIMGRTGFASAPPVTHVRVGDVLDSQRRRRRKLKETYVNASVPL